MTKVAPITHEEPTMAKHSFYLDRILHNTHLCCNCGWVMPQIITDTTTNDKIRLAKIEHVLREEGLME